MGDLKKVRVDKWLWAVRIFKSRTMATDACKAGKIKLKGISLKPSYLITTGETVEVKKNGFNLCSHRSSSKIKLYRKSLLADNFCII